MRRRTIAASKRRASYAAMAAWRKYAAQNRAVKDKLRKLFARHKEFFFNRWADWLDRRKRQHAEDEERKEKGKAIEPIGQSIEIESAEGEG